MSGEVDYIAGYTIEGGKSVEVGIYPAPNQAADAARQGKAQAAQWLYKLGLADSESHALQQIKPWRQKRTRVETFQFGDQETMDFEVID